MMGPPRRWRPLLGVTLLFLFACYLAIRNDRDLLDRYGPSGIAAPNAPPPKVPPPPSPPSTGAAPPSQPPKDGPQPPAAGAGAPPQQVDPAGAGLAQDATVGGQAPLRLIKLPDRYPVARVKSLPTALPEAPIPRMQNVTAPAETAEEKEQRQARLEAVKASFLRSWGAYKEHAWMADEVQPVSAQPRQDYNKLGGWAATLVDSLDALWIMGMKDEFRMAVKAAATIDFSHTEAETINVFETTIRYLGGFLGAYEISNKAHPVLLKKATEVGDFLLGAFDTPNRLPFARWDWRAYARGGLQTSAPKSMLSAELGSLSLEFTKLSQLTGEPRYYDAVQRISDVLAAHQTKTQLPGMWPVVVDAAGPSFNGNGEFTLGGRADSLFEYLPKQFLLLGGALEQPRRMYEGFLPVAKKHIFRRVSNDGNHRLVLPGDARVVDDSLSGRTVKTSPRGQHLSCFVGGMVGLAGRAFGREWDVDLAGQLTDGCVYVYNSTATGIGPEKYYFDPCGSIAEDQKGMRCIYTEGKWRDSLQKHWKSDDPHAIDQIIKDGRVKPGLLDIDDPGYQLRPEAVESMFVMWRLTGDRAWQNKAWHMFQQIVKHTGAMPGARADQTGQVAAAGIEDVTSTDSPASDHMETFWLAETLKYFYLMFADWDVVSLDEWVLNTEGHPLRRADADRKPDKEDGKKKDE